MRTGGPLNFLNELATTNSRRNSVSVMKLLEFHQCKTPRQLELEIQSHQKYCKCGVKSSGSVHDFAGNLFRAQTQFPEFSKKFPGQSFTFKDCYNFMYTLFCKAPLRGLDQELKSQKILGTKYTILKSSEYDDFKNGIDYFIKNGTELIGIQVKPKSFFRRNNIVTIQDIKHANSGYAVRYHIYDESLNFLDFKK
jgi:hypothetical protein